MENKTNKQTIPSRDEIIYQAYLIAVERNLNTLQVDQQDILTHDPFFHHCTNENKFGYKMCLLDDFGKLLPFNINIFVEFSYDLCCEVKTTGFLFPRKGTINTLLLNTVELSFEGRSFFKSSIKDFLKKNEKITKERNELIEILQEAESKPLIDELRNILFNNG